LGPGEVADVDQAVGPHDLGLGVARILLLVGVEMGERGMRLALPTQGLDHPEIEAALPGGVELGGAEAELGGERGRGRGEDECCGDQQGLHPTSPIKALTRVATAGPASTTNRAGMKKIIITMAIWADLRPTAARAFATR